MDEVFDGEKFRGLGYISEVKGATETKNEEDVVAFNIYGAAAKDSKKVFGDPDAWAWSKALLFGTMCYYGRTVSFAGGELRWSSPSHSSSSMMLLGRSRTMARDLILVQLLTSTTTSPSLS